MNSPPTDQGTTSHDAPPKGSNTQEIIRCLKRYVAREVFPLVRNIIDEHDTQLAA